MNAQEAVERGLLEQYAPLLRYHDQEPLRADSPAIMTNAALPGRQGTRLVDASGQVLASAVPTVGVDRLSLDYLGSYTGAGRAKTSDRLVLGSRDWQRDAQAMRILNAGFADRVYAQAVQEDGRGRVWLQYWFFFYFNDKGLRGIGDHDGDWETIQIGLTDGGDPEIATFAQHTYGERRDWKHVRTRDGDPQGPPIVWVALGSHASYYEPGTYRIRNLPIPVADFTLENNIEVRPTVERLETERWLAWPGRWGSEGGPDGPLQHSQYGKPDAWHTSRKVTNRRKGFGRVFLAVHEWPPEPRGLTAREVDGAVSVSWELPALHADRPGVPVRVLVSIRRDDGRSPAATESVPVTAPEGQATLRLPAGAGTLEAALTAFDADDRPGPTARVSVSAPPSRRRARVTAFPPSRQLETTLKPARAAAPLRLLVLTSPDDHAGPNLTQAVARTLDVDADGAPWRIEPLFPRTGGVVPDRLRPFWTVSGRVSVASNPPFTGLAFDIARRLADATGYEVQPDLPSTAFGEPETDETAPGKTGARRAHEKPPIDWAMDKMGLRDLDTLEPTKGAGVFVAQPDTGITAHEALVAVDRTNDFDVIDLDRDATDPLDRDLLRPLLHPGHGTGTASVIVGPGPGAPLGVAPNVTLVPIRTVSSVVQVLDGDVALAIDYARRLRVDVITMSLGGLGFFPALRETIAAAVDEGIIVMSAGGNYAPWVVAPARYPECLAVAATGQTDLPWRWSSSGPEIDWSAPGEDVWKAKVREKHGTLEFDVATSAGSSFAVAHSAAIAARWIALHGREELRRRYPGALQWTFLSLVTATIRRPSRWKTHRHGCGIINAYGVLNAQLPSGTPARLPAARRPAVARGATNIAAARLAPLVPEVPRAELPGRLEAVLNVAPAVLPRFAGELAYHLSEDPGLRSALVASRRAGARARGGAAATARARLAASASRELREKLG